MGDHVGQFVSILVGEFDGDIVGGLVEATVGGAVGMLVGDVDGDIIGK